MAQVIDVGVAVLSENDRLLAEVKALREENAQWQDRCLAMQTERDEAREEVKRLRAEVAAECSRADRLISKADKEQVLAEELHESLCAARRERDRAEAEVKRLEGLILSVARVIRGRDGLPCWCDDYDARPDRSHSAKCMEARRIRDEEKPRG